MAFYGSIFFANMGGVGVVKIVFRCGRVFLFFSGGFVFAYCGAENLLHIRVYYLRDMYCNCFTGLGRLGNIYLYSGVSTESER